MFRLGIAFVAGMTLAALLAVQLHGQDAKDGKKTEKATEPPYILVIEDGWSTKRTVVHIVGLKPDVEKELNAKQEDGRIVIDGRRIYLTAGALEKTVTLKREGTIVYGVKVEVPSGIPIYFKSVPKK